jgi:hypothetical protein
MAGRLRTCCCWCTAKHGRRIMILPQQSSLAAAFLPLGPGWDDRACDRMRSPSSSHTPPPLTYAGVKCEHTTRSSFIHSCGSLMQMHPVAAADVATFTCSVTTAACTHVYQSEATAYHIQLLCKYYLSNCSTRCCLLITHTHQARCKSFK